MLTDTKIAAIKPPESGQQEYPDQKVTGLRLRVGAGGAKTWTVRRRLGPKVINKKLGTYPAMKLSAARTAAEKLIEALELDGSTETLDRTFGDVARRWLTDKAKEKNKRWRDQERRLDIHVLPHWEDRKISEIRRRDVRDLLDGIEGVVLPNRVLALIRPIFRFAVSRDWIDASPAESIEPPRSEVRRDRVLDMDEVKRVWDCAALLGYPAGQYFRMLLLTGQRRTEVSTMRWDAIDRENRTWTVSSDNKSGRVHLVPLSPLAMEVLDNAPELGPFVFTSDGKTSISNFAKSKRKLDEFIAAKGEALAPWRLHDLRRTAATHMVRLGVSMEIAGRVLNHAAKGITATTYGLHDYAPEKRIALDKWSAEIDRAVNAAKTENVVQLHG